MKRAIICGIVLFGMGMWFITFAYGAKDAKYVGSPACQACHLKDYMSWKKMKHAKVFDDLIGAETANPDCLKCHTTGYGKEGGFVSAEKTAGLKGVGCEACHGAGSAHVEAAKSAPKTGAWDTMIKKTPDTCTECHNPHVNQKERVEELRKGKPAA